MKEIKDYLHLYLGCNCDLTRDEFHFPHEVTFDIGLLKQALDCLVIVKPILRPLRDITEAEKDYALKLGNSYLDSWIGGANRTAWLISKHFDLFGLIESGLAIDKTTLNQ